MSSAILLACAYLAATAARPAVPASFPDPRCGLRFSYPADWTLTIEYPEVGGCSLVLAPPEAQEVVMTSPGTPDEPCYLGEIRVGVVRSSVEDLARQQNFSRVEGVWRYRVGTIFDNGKADTLSGIGWHGFRGASTSHYCGSAQTTYDIVLGHRTRGVSIGVHAEKLKVAEQILRTLKVMP